LNTTLAAAPERVLDLGQLSHTGIHSLATEILVKIFKEYMNIAKAIQYESPSAGLILLSICRKWREIALRNSDCWTTVSVELDFYSPFGGEYGSIENDALAEKRTVCTWARVKRQFDLATGRKIDFIFWYATENGLFSTFQFLKQHMPPLRTYWEDQVFVGFDCFLDFVPYLDKARYQDLTHLRICHNYGPRIRFLTLLGGSITLPNVIVLCLLCVEDAIPIIAYLFAPKLQYLTVFTRYEEEELIISLPLLMEEINLYPDLCELALPRATISAAIGEDEQRTPINVHPGVKKLTISDQHPEDSACHLNDSVHRFPNIKTLTIPKLRSILPRTFHPHKNIQNFVIHGHWHIDRDLTGSRYHPQSLETAIVILEGLPNLRRFQIGRLPDISDRSQWTEPNPSDVLPNKYTACDVFLHFITAIGLKSAGGSASPRVCKQLKELLFYHTVTNLETLNTTLECFVNRPPTFRVSLRGCTCTPTLNLTLPSTQITLPDAIDLQFNSLHKFVEECHELIRQTGE
jgi:hypothetical protein